MAKSADAFRTISEVADWLGVPAHVLRFWESKFSQVKPVKRAGGRRYYRPADMALLGGIRKLLHDDGMTIKGVQKILREHGIKHVAAFSGPLDSELDAAEEAAARDQALDVPPDAPMQSGAEPETARVLSFSRETEDQDTAPAAPAAAAARATQTQTEAQTARDPAPAPPADPTPQDAAGDASSTDPDATPADPVSAPDVPEAPRPLPVTVPDDPPDSIQAPAGPMASLARLDAGSAAEKRAALSEIAQRLRACSSSAS